MGHNTLTWKSALLSTDATLYGRLLTIHRSLARKMNQMTGVQFLLNNSAERWKLYSPLSKEIGILLGRTKAKYLDRISSQG